MGISREMQVYRFIPLAVIAAGLPLAAATAAPAVQLAQAQTPQRPAQQAQAPKPMTKTDFTKTIDSRFTNIDTNKDGSLSGAEIGAVQTRAMQQAAVAQQQKLEAEFKKLDTNKDNQVSLAEFKAALPPITARETPAQMLAQLDSNKDGKVSNAEYRTLPLANFDKMDANKDGTVTPQEVAAARSR